jgi:hypothetical protein
VKKTTPWIAGGVAVAALAGGIGFGLAARSAEGDLEDRDCGSGTPQACPDSDVDSLERKALLADVFYGTALVAAGAAVFIQLKWGTRTEPTPISVTPTSDGAGAALTVRRPF